MGRPLLTRRVSVVPDEKVEERLTGRRRWNSPWVNVAVVEVGGGGEAMMLLVLLYVVYISWLPRVRPKT